MKSLCLNRKSFLKIGLRKLKALVSKPGKEVLINGDGRRVVVTGMGMVTTLGDQVDVFNNNLLEGVSGVTEIESFDCSQFPTIKFSTLASYLEKLMTVYIHVYM